MPTAERTVTIVNDKGLHVRAATVLAQTAAKYGSTITVARGGDKANGKSIMNLLLLTAAKGTEVHVSATGDDAEAALAAVTQVIEDGFYES